MRFQEAELNQILDLYAEWTGRTVLRPQGLPQPKITLRAQTKLTKKEAIQALDTILALNQISMVTPTAKLTGKGAMSYLPAQSLMPEGKVTLRFTGIDALAAAMQKRGKNDEMAQQIMGITSGIRAMGKPDPTSSASDRAYIIDIVFGKDGSISANGQKVF
jgi:hypothetical protein